MDLLLLLSGLFVVIGIVLIIYLIINIKKLEKNPNKKYRVLRNTWFFGALCFLLTLITTWQSSSTAIVNYALKIVCIILFLINAFLNHRKINYDN